MPTQTTPIRDLRARAVKAAELGGDGSDMSFEQAFANLAHAYLRDKAPGLLDYEVGFQLVDRNEDNTKAVGIFGFKVASNWLYAPVFWIDGDLKGHELLYIKNQDAFVPLKENWINYLLAKKPLSLGEGVPRDTQRMGVRSPDMSMLTASPHKYAAWNRMPAWARDAAMAMGKAAGPVDLDPILPGVLAKGGVKLAACLKHHLDEFPVLRRAFERFYEPSEIEAACKAAAEARLATPKRAAARIRGGSLLDAIHPRHKVAVHELDGASLRVSGNKGLLLDRDDKVALMQSGMLIKDAREDDEVSKAYAVPVKVQEPQTLFNPTESGLYDVLVRAGKTEKCAVFSGPIGAGRGTSFCTVVRVGDEGSRNWLNIHDSHVWCSKQYERKDWDAWYEGLPDADSLEVGRSAVMLIGPRGQATLPFRVREALGNEDGSKSYTVSFHSYANKDRPAFGPYHPERYDRWDRFDSCREGERIILGMAKGSKLRSDHGDVYCPDGFKKLVCKREAPKPWDNDEKMAPPEGQSEAPPIDPGSFVDVELEIRKTASLVRLSNDGHTASIDGRPMRVKAALLHLILDRGLREAAARECMDKAARCRLKGQAFEFLIKYADPYLTGGGPNAPGIPEPAMGQDGFMGSQAQTQQPQQDLVPVTDMATDPSGRDAYRLDGPDPQASQVAQQAAQTGQREIFDTAMVGSLLKTTREDLMVDKHLSDLMKGLDRVGRLLFIFYWHQDEFADRYGKPEMPELEDSLRNTFESLGDLVLFLKQRSIEASPEESAQAIDLGSTANQ